MANNQQVGVGSAPNDGLGDALRAAWIKYNSHGHPAADIVSGTLADARVAESNVTQHEAALTITESQVSDLGDYITVAGVTFENLDANGDVGTGATQVAAGDHGHAISAVTGLQTALDGKQADLDVPSQAEAEAGTATTERVWTAQRVGQAIAALVASPISTAISALSSVYLALAGGTVTGQISLGSGGSINDAGPITASGSLTRATHGGRVVKTSGNVTIPNASGDVGMGGMIIGGGAHTVTFNSLVSAALASGDVVSYYVESTTVIHAVKVLAANKMTFS